VKSTGRSGRHAPWKKGKSGNPAGRPRGNNVLVEAAREGFTRAGADAIVARLIKSAKFGSTKAVLALARLLPSARFALVPNATPIASAPDAGAAMGKLADQMLSGDLSISEASAAVAVIGSVLAGLAGSSDLQTLIARLDQMKAIVQERDAPPSAPSGGPRLPWETATSELGGPPEPIEP
jgi:hypothetical protein